MGEMYIRSQDRERLYRMGGEYACVKYMNYGDAKHVLCISSSRLEEIGEYESKERCLMILNEIQEACGLTFYEEDGRADQEDIALPRVYVDAKTVMEHMEDKDKERGALEDRFYEIYRPLQKKYNLRYYIHSSLYDDGLIEIWEYHGEVRGKLICRVKEEDTAECYKRAVDVLEEYKKYKEGREHGKNADMAV